MLPEIKEQTKKDFEAAAQKLGISTELPNVSMLRPDLALYITAHYMLAVLIEASKDGKQYDITNHSKRKYSAWFEAEEGYVPGSSGGSFSYFDFGHDLDSSNVCARLTSNTWEECKEFAEKYIDLWEIIMLLVS
ncbi:hypothetical protein [Paraflavitalea speifideaquila]|uniref:hypothetical protein n=1 Tax=Paraflavitalea speifideaquila TaxID=3076558 RepID=UPI0028E60E78|nr:hypothetical protein [Paraflavitalea speifideiaquila]